MLKISLKQVVTAPKAFPLFACSSYLPPPLCCDENQHLSLTLSQQLEHLHCFVLYRSPLYSIEVLPSFILFKEPSQT